MIKRILLLSFIASFGNGICHGQNTPSVYSTSKPNASSKQPSPNKAKLLDSVTINDNKLGSITINMKEFRAEALKKTKQLTEYIGVITNNASSNDNANIAIDQALTLFVNKNATVEISQAGIHNKNSLPVKIKPYLNGLKLHTHFDKIEVTYSNIAYVPEFKKGPDGNFYSVVTFEQRFTGSNEQQMVYGDITKKNVVVVLKTYSKMGTNGVSKTFWHVFLSDIGVDETISLPVPTKKKNN
ncbi:hypothetical protein [Mucilaginibacter paludis]|uniref:Uncharacterized protein n=1 Tax=Mucilaginibacter paludis DSM 18603 TaxID=714943 RepID=H1Y8M1_9SPHI|nr:hypothetical protein [Mucilaginibacter paludis]EHQ26893.1 hypothetical protein Mucpa_2781 [Mucilaginibacter paludis DSM 18603]